MSDQKQLYIGLGSNVGNRLSYLQLAIDSIHCEVGSVLKISYCYETPAMGFEGDAFINACIQVRTCYSAELVLSKLLQIEEQHGRRRFDDGQYHSRTIDLDILFFNEDIIENNILSVPHPRLDQRRFVLQPLNDIAPELIHPVQKKTISTSRLL